MTEGWFLYALAMLARSAALGSAAFLLVAAPPAVRPLARYVTTVAAVLAVLVALLVLPSTAGWGGWIGALMALGGGAATAALAWKDGPPAPIVGAATVLLLGGILQGGAHAGALPVLATFLRESGAAIWMGSLPLLWFALRGTGAMRSARNHRTLALGGMALALPGVLLLWGQAGAGFTAQGGMILATAVLILGLVKLTLWQAWLLRGEVPPDRLLALTEAAILIATALCGPIAALFMGVPVPGLWAVLPVFLVAAALALSVWFTSLPGGILALLLVAAGTVALGAGAALVGLLAVMAGCLRWLARRQPETCEGSTSQAFWPGVALAALVAALLVHAV
ncbi:hypothetical protein [Roseococcus thiosulfatophilus]|uniref:hypothetical protein n=1 Tax=Roseococcus thiosulfatophilus TaxID=35813 RepID=UPI001A8F4889|nr:hypothetical protein [Roseococcus thiosulfatophilus]